MPTGAHSQHFGITGGHMGLQQLELPGNHDPIPWMHSPSSSCWAGVGTWYLALKTGRFLGRLLSSSHGSYPAVGPQWNGEAPCPMRWMYSLLRAEMLPRALLGHVELRVSGNWDRNICWGSGGSEIVHCPTGEMGAWAQKSAPVSAGRPTGMEEL